MRLTCPNCEAQYEIDASMIPQEGRDVQCSACGHAWFQPNQMAAAHPKPGTKPERPAERPRPEPAAARTADEDPAEAGPKPRPLDEAARAVLREEALREAEARRRESAGDMETQPDLGLDDEPPRDKGREPVRFHSARPETDSPDSTEAEVDAAVAAAVSGSRGGLLPDIEEINSTLTATSERRREERDEDEEDSEVRRGAFRVGFLTMLSLIAVLALLYVFGPSIANAVPALAPIVAGYLDWATGVLNAIESGMASLIDTLNDLLGGSGGTPQG